MIDPFATLGMAPTFEVDLPALEKQYRELSRVLHPDRYVGSSAAERRMSLGKAVEVNDAWRIVRDPIRRADALLRRLGAEIVEGKEPKPDPAFLMDMMEQREALADARAQKSTASVKRLAEEIKKREAAAVAKLATGFAAESPRLANPSHGTPPESAAKLAAILGELRYYRRFLDEVSAIEDALDEASPALSSE